MTAPRTRYFLDKNTGRVVRDGIPPYASAPERWVEVVVIEGPLPEVTVDEQGIVHTDGAAMGCEDGVKGSYARMARRYAAVDAYLRERPPVDEAQVQALAAVFRDAEMFESGVVKADEDFARRLVQRGVRVDGVDR